MNSGFRIITLLVLLVSGLFLQGCRNDMELLRNKFIDELMAPAVDVKRVADLVSSIREDGTWPGIDYTDTTRVAFQHKDHLDNMVQMARALMKKGSPYKGDQELSKALLRALDYWLENDFICENWWWNQIGTPTAMVSLLLILDKELTGERVEKMLAIAGRAHLNASGARPSGDRIKIAGILAKATLFRRDEKMAEEVIRVIEGEIKFAPDEQQKLNAEGKPSGERMIYPGTGRGMQYDFSFHHRADRVNNTLSYGTGYADAFAEWAANVTGTRYSFSDSSLRLLTDYYLDGICRQMVFGIYPDPGVKNRDITRAGSGRAFSTSTPERLLKASDYRRPELENIIKARKGEDFTVESFAKFFWQTEHFVFQRPGFYTSVRMYSTRNRNIEQPYNGEGLTNHYRADGTNYISLRGDEYMDIAPVSDWRRIPGATVLEGSSMPPENQIQKAGLTDFVGGVTDGLYGAVAFDFISPHDGVKAKKSWFFFDREYICLGAGIECDERENDVSTTLNQCLLNGNVTASMDGKTEIIPTGNRRLENVNWVHHDSIGYLFNDHADINIFNRESSGTWYSINRQTSSSKDTIRKEVFRLWLNHGRRPAGGKYEYVVLPASGLGELEKYSDDPAIEVLSNTAGLQAVFHRELKILYAVFYEHGTLNGPGNLNISSNHPCMVMIRQNEGSISSITVSDPSRKNEKLAITINRRIQTSNDQVSSTWNSETGTSEIVFSMPQGKDAGKSITLKI